MLVGVGLGLKFSVVFLAGVGLAGSGAALAGTRVGGRAKAEMPLAPESQAVDEGALQKEPAKAGCAWPTGK